MPNIFKRMKSLICDDNDDKKKPLTAHSRTKLKPKHKKHSKPSDFDLTFPHTARNTFSTNISLKRACGLARSITSSTTTDNKVNLLERGIDDQHMDKADYQAIADYVHVANDEISLIKNDQLLFIRSNYIDFVLVKNMRNKKIGFVPLNNVAEIEDLKEKE